ncbi:MAG: hypothetical protein MZV70_33900 [Desulfobacterales bacterium]|nr:hypothetical protein [Desulfobacterales bacterium]
MCDQGPALLVNGRAIPRSTTARIEQIAELILARTPLAEWPRGALRRAGQRAPRGHPARPRAEARRCDPRRAAARRARLVRARGERALLARGVRRRGAGPDRDARGDQALQPARPRRRRLHHRHQVGGLPRTPPALARYVVCNADEGEPGTFKDRVLLAQLRRPACSTA